MLGATVGFGFSSVLGVLFGVGTGEFVGDALGATVGEIVGVAVGVETTAFTAVLFEMVEFELLYQNIPPMPLIAKRQTAVIGKIQNNLASDFDSDFFSKIGKSSNGFLLSTNGSSKYAFPVNSDFEMLPDGCVLETSIGKDSATSTGEGCVTDGGVTAG